VLQGLEAASNCVEDMDEWLGMFNVKLRHMREDIESVRACTLKVRAHVPIHNFFAVL
jgi:poly(A) polymerase Pap1